MLHVLDDFWAQDDPMFLGIACTSRSRNMVGKCFGCWPACLITCMSLSIGYLDLLLNFPWRFPEDILFPKDPRDGSPTRLASQCAGVPSPSVVRPSLLGSLGPKALQSGVHTARRGPSHFSFWAPSWLQVRIFSQFVCIFFARCFEVAFFYRFLMVFEWILEGLGKVLRVFWRWFFTRFSKN